MSEVVTRQDIAEVRRDIDQALSVLRDFVDQVDERFTGLEKKYDHLISTIDGFVGRIDK